MSVVIGEEYKNWSWSKGALPFYLCNDCCCKNLSYHDHIQQSLVSGAGVDDHKWNHRGLQAIRDYGITNAGRFIVDHNFRHSNTNTNTNYKYGLQITNYKCRTIQRWPQFRHRFYGLEPVWKLKTSSSRLYILMWNSFKRAAASSSGRTPFIF